MNIASVGAGFGAAGSLPANTAPAPVLTVPAPDKSAVSAGAARTLASPSMAGDDWVKSQARSTIQQLVERLKILKKLFAGDPKAMARALAQIFKELKAAVQAYAKAGGDEMGLAAGAAPPSPTPATPTGESAKDASAPTPPVPADHALYDAVVGETRKLIGEDGLSFLKDVRSLTGAISDVLEASRVQAKAKKPEKSLTEALDDADKALGSLRDAMHDMEQDIHMAAPTAGMKLSMNA